MQDEAVTGTEAAPEGRNEAGPDAQVKSADDLLEEALAETKIPETKPTPSPTTVEAQLAEIQRRQDEAERRDSQNRMNSALNDSVGRILKDETVSSVYDAEEIEAFVRKEAETDPAILAAFTQQFDNPVGWEKVEKALTAKYAEKASKKPNANLTQDIEAAQAAARGVSNQAPVNPDRPSDAELVRMAERSPGQFRKFVRGG